MDFVYKVSPVFIILAVLMYLEAASDLRRSVWQRLEERYDDEEMLPLLDQIKERKKEFPLSYRLFKGKYFAEREHLDQFMLPDILCHLVRQILLVAALAGTALIFGEKIRLPGIVPLILLVIELILLLIYLITERTNAREVLIKSTQLTQKSMMQGSNDPDTGLPFTKEEKKIVRQAYFLRYSPEAVLPVLFFIKETWIWFLTTGVLLLLLSLHTRYNLKHKTDALFCAEQIHSKRPLTPHKHSGYIQAKALRTFSRIWVALMISGILFSAMGIIFTVLEFS